MPRTKLAVLPAIAAAVLFAPAVQADTRSSAALPSKAASAAAAQSQAKAPQGPKNGFPDNAGIARATQVANENARFLRTDSAG